jgi:hypothetical protein
VLAARELGDGGEDEIAGEVALIVDEPGHGGRRGRGRGGGGGR